MNGTTMTHIYVYVWICTFISKQSWNCLIIITNQFFFMLIWLFTIISVGISLVDVRGKVKNEKKRKGKKKESPSAQIYGKRFTRRRVEAGAPKPYIFPKYSHNLPRFITNKLTKHRPAPPPPSYFFIILPCSYENKMLPNGREKRSHKQNFRMTLPLFTRFRTIFGRKFGKAPRATRASPLWSLGFATSRPWLLLWSSKDQKVMDYIPHKNL